MSLKVVILAAGMGSRLGRSLPKPLTELNDGRSIMQQQIENIKYAFGEDTKITAVVGYKSEYIINRFPKLKFVHNDLYDQTNTSKSLLKAFMATGKSGVLWMNGDVVFDPETLVRARKNVLAEKSFVTVNTSKVSDEEVKYTLDDKGFVSQLSKEVKKNALGEAVGINFIAEKDKKTVQHYLKSVKNQDYFEKALELAILNKELNLEIIDISDLYAVEVDFAEDLTRANLFV